MRMSHAHMYSRVLAGDADYNGRFFTGVLSTGIYCLPSCKARKPKPQNVRFFPTCEAARAEGLRPCKKCHPDDFARGADPVVESLETLVGEIREDPARFGDARAVVRRSGFGSTRCFELLRQHFHATPADLLLKARLQRAKQLLRGADAGLAEVAAHVGFESLSTFHEHFRQANGLTPSSYREIRKKKRFQLELPEDYPLAHLLRSLGRDKASLTERVVGSRFETSLVLDSTPCILRMEFSPASVTVSWESFGPCTPEARWHAHATAVAMLGLDQDASAFCKLAKRLGFARLVAGRKGLRINQTPTAFDGLVWAIIGQQINLDFAFVLKRRLVENLGKRLDGGLYALPTPQAIADLEPKDMRAWQYSRQKAEYLVGAARAVASGALDLEGLSRRSATAAERSLLSIRGLGPWSVNYLMMRSLGFADCVPLGDTGVTSGLRALFDLDERPDADATRRLMSVFRPYRSLATAHIWQFNQPAPS